MQNQSNKVKIIEQPDIIRQVYHDLHGEYTLEQIQAIVMAEQNAVERFLAKGYKISKYGYMVLYTSKVSPRKLKCPINGKDYHIPETIRVNVRVGAKLKRAVQAPPPGGKKPAQTKRNSSGQSVSIDKDKGSHLGTKTTTIEAVAQ